MAPKSCVVSIRAFLELRVGMHVHCIMTVHNDPESCGFVQRFSGECGTIMGFSTTTIGPLDVLGRMPGVYLNPNGIHVRFDGEKEIHKDLNVSMFHLISAAKPKSYEGPLSHQRISDLPSPIPFYPGDIVKYKGEDRSVDIVIYKGSGFKIGFKDEPTWFHPEKLQFVHGGNVRWLYTDPSKMSFDSPEEQIRFWSHGGISKHVYSGGTALGSIQAHTKEDALKLAPRLKGDIVAESPHFAGKYIVRQLHSCFAEHRRRVRKLTLA